MSGLTARLGALCGKRTRWQKRLVPGNEISKRDESKQKGAQESAAAPPPRPSLLFSRYVPSTYEALTRRCVAGDVIGDRVEDDFPLVLKGEDWRTLRCTPGGAAPCMDALSVSLSSVRARCRPSRGEEEARNFNNDTMSWVGSGQHTKK